MSRVTPLEQFSVSDVAANPVLAEVIRSGMVESRHRGSIVAIGADGMYAFTAGSANEVFKLMAITGAELHRAAPGTVIDWHTAPRRQYVITLSGQAEIEVAGGKKITVGPGHIDLVEDTTGKGHITKVTGNEERVTLQLPLSEQANR